MLSLAYSYACTDTKAPFQNLSLVWGGVDAPRRCRRNVEDQSVHGTLLLSKQRWVTERPAVKSRLDWDSCLCNTDTGWTSIRRVINYFCFDLSSLKLNVDADVLNIEQHLFYQPWARAFGRCLCETSRMCKYAIRVWYQRCCRKTELLR